MSFQATSTEIIQPKLSFNFPKLPENAGLYLSAIGQGIFIALVNYILDEYVIRGNPIFENHPFLEAFAEGGKLIFLYHLISFSHENLKKIAFEKPTRVIDREPYYNALAIHALIIFFSYTM